MSQTAESAKVVNRQSVIKDVTEKGNTVYETIDPRYKKPKKIGKKQLAKMMRKRLKDLKSIPDGVIASSAGLLLADKGTLTARVSKKNKDKLVMMFQKKRRKR